MSYLLNSPFPLSLWKLEIRTHSLKAVNLYSLITFMERKCVLGTQFPSMHQSKWTHFLRKIFEACIFFWSSPSRTSLDQQYQDDNVDDNVRESNQGITHMNIVSNNEVVRDGIYGFCHQSLKPS